MPILLKRDDAIATVVIDRVAKHNALDPAHMMELRQRLMEASADPEIRVIVITGAGEKAFCAGADLTAPRQNEASLPEGLTLGLEDSADRGLYIRLLDLSGLAIRKPLVAVVNGFCLGAGLELALQCDLILASENATFGLPEVQISSYPGGNGVPNLLRAVPRAVAMRMLLTGERLAASRAYQVGLVSDVWSQSDFASEVKGTVEKIALSGPIAVQLVKMQAQNAVDMTAAQSWQFTELAWGILRDSEDRREGRKAFSEKRRPEFKGR